MATVTQYLKSERLRHVEDLKEILRIPSVSTDSNRVGEVKRAAHWVADRLQQVGCTLVKIHKTPGHPIVYGEWTGAKGAPTILVYGHYDVQPEDPIDLWKTPPFEPTVKAGKLFARGASDDKGQFLIHPLALEAHLKTSGTCPVNVKFLLEGEEEIGSPNLVPFVNKNLKRLACDAVVVSDTAMYAKNIPSICYGLRGLAYLQIDVRGTNRDLHSGVYGGAVANPAIVLTQILASLKDKRGRIAIPGFYDKVKRLTAAERKTFAALPFSERKYRQSIGAPGLTGETGYTTLERSWARPSLDINGIWGGFMGEGAKTVIPAEVSAKISFRLVPDQTPGEIERMVIAHLRRIAPKTVEVNVRNLHGGEPWVASTDHPALQAASRAYKRGFGKRPVFTREGGSIPIVAAFDKLLKVPAIMMGIGLQDDNLHAPNEKIDLDNFHKGIATAAYLMEELGNDAGKS